MPRGRWPAVPKPLIRAYHKYLGVAKTLFKAQLAWRFEIAVNMAFSVARILLAYLLWGAIFQGRQTVGGLTFDGMLTYYLLSAFLTQLDLSNGISGEISSRIRNGTFSKYMVIPCNIFGYFSAQTLGACAFYMIFNLIAVVAWALLFGLRLTFSVAPGPLLAAAVMCLMGLLFMMQFHALLGILTFKFQNIDVFLMIQSNLVTFATGAMIPLVLLPGALVVAMRCLPFYYITYLPTMLLMGRNIGEAGLGLLILGAWNLMLLSLNPLLYRRLRTKYDGVGI